MAGSYDSIQYAPKRLRACFLPQDRYHLKPHLDFDSLALEASNHLHSSDFSFGTFREITIKSKPAFLPQDFKDVLALRLTDKLLRRSLHFKPSNRDDEVRLVATSLATAPSCNIIRCDVKSFFESINFESIIGKLENKHLASNNVVKYLRGINLVLRNNHNYPGLPRGLSISSTLAEFYLSSFDKNIAGHMSVMTYSRFVDDMFIMHYENPSDLLSYISGVLEGLCLSLNYNKTRQYVNGSCAKCSFLGYEFTLSQPVQIRIHPSKIGRQKTRIVLALRKYAKDRDFELLKARMSYLTITTRIRKHGRAQPIYIGLASRYKECPESELTKHLTELDAFYYAILNSKKYSLAASLKPLLTPKQRAELCNISFLRAFKNKIISSLRPDQIETIRKAWAHV